MAVLVYIDSADGQLKKSSYEAICYASALATQMNSEALGVLINEVDIDPSTLGKYGLKKVIHLQSSALEIMDSKLYTQAIADVVAENNVEVIVFTNNSRGRAIAPRLSVRLKAGLVPGAVALPNTANGFLVKKNVFSGKAFAEIKITTDKKIISLNANAYKVTEGEGIAEVISKEITLPASSLKIEGEDKVKGEVPLGEAEIVVSGGRGLKGPENWALVEDLAQILHAATACSRPVADSDWRPHHEHVGQTGVAIAPNLYIAIGISGAIQHLAGVNRSKVMVVFNKDPEAPFFKAADYGVVGDAFETVPKFTEAVKKIVNY